MFARYSTSGHLLFVRGDSLLVAPFDPTSLELGAPLVILENVVAGHSGQAEYAVSR